MGLNTPGINAFLNDGNEAVVYVALGNGVTELDQVSDARVLLTSAVVGGVITATGVPYSFAGTPSAPVTSVLLYNAPTGGTFYGSVPLTGDQVFSAGGAYDLMALTITGLTSTLTPEGVHAVLDDGNETVVWAAVGDGPVAINQVSDARMAVIWAAPASQRFAAANVPLAFTGTPGVPATHLLTFDAPTAGTFLGSVALTGDHAFSPSGDFHVSAASVAGSVPGDIPAGFPNEFNTGLAGVGMNESDLSPYTGPGGYAGSGIYLVEDQLVADDIRVFDSVNITLRRCKITGHIDIDSAAAHLTLEDCHVSSGAWTNAAVGFQQMTILRCNIEGGITAVNASQNVTITDSYLHGQVISPTGSDHAGGFLCSGGGSIEIDHCTVWCSAQDNGFGGGPSNNLNLFGDFAELDGINVHDSYFPVTGGGYSVSLGYNPGKPHGDTPSNIVFTDNVLARNPPGPGGKGGVFGTVTSFLESDPTNIYLNNVWADDGSPVPVNA